MQTPSVARMVHYVAPRSGFASPCQAVITETTEHPEADMTAGLFVMDPISGRSFRGIPCDLGSDSREISGRTVAQCCDGLWHGAETWHWPARV
jgi:hypothetical protein